MEFFFFSKFVWVTSILKTGSENTFSGKFTLKYTLVNLITNWEQYVKI